MCICVCHIPKEPVTYTHYRNMDAQSALSIRVSACLGQNIGCIPKNVHIYTPAHMYIYCVACMCSLQL